MQEIVKLVPRVAIFLAGVAAGAVTLTRREGAGIEARALADLKHSVSDLEQRLRLEDAAQAARLQKVEDRLDEHASRLDEHAARLADVPSTSQIVAAMEQLLQKTMASLDDRLTTQSRSIDVLKTTVTQTDSLLERVLESLDSLQGGGEVVEPAGVPPAARETVTITADRTTRA